MCACSLVCKQGILHLLAGEPSLCYVHDGDGVCEPFEKTSSVLDCGPYTPNGYVDLWAAKAYASHQDEKSCPASLATGEPVAKVSEGMTEKKTFLAYPHPLPVKLGDLLSEQILLRQKSKLQSSSESVD